MFPFAQARHTPAGRQCALRQLTGICPARAGPPARGTKILVNEHGGKIPPCEVELERPVSLQSDQECRLTLILDDSVCEVYLNDQVAMSARLYDRQQGNLGFFVADGEATFSHLLVKTP
jgi:beta-fructofuranosidase